MHTVSVSELKANLSRYLREVRRGGEVQVLDRGVPVARLSRLPASADAADEQRRQRLLQAGIVRSGQCDLSEILQAPPLELPVSVLESLEAERADRQ